MNIPKPTGPQLLVIALVTGLVIGAAVAWSLQGSRLRPRIKELEKQARGLQHKADAWQAEAARAQRDADSIAALVGLHRDTITIIRHDYESDRIRYAGAGVDSIRAVILWANPH